MYDEEKDLLDQSVYSVILHVYYFNRASFNSLFFFYVFWVFENEISHSHYTSFFCFKYKVVNDFHRVLYSSIHLRGILVKLSHEFFDCVIIILDDAPYVQHGMPISFPFCISVRFETCCRLVRNTIP